MRDIHHHYNQLTPEEKEAVDHCFNPHTGTIWTIMDVHGIRVKNGDQVERAVDAMARWVIESRENTVPAVDLSNELHDDLEPFD